MQRKILIVPVMSVETIIQYILHKKDLIKEIIEKLVLLDVQILMSIHKNGKIKYPKALKTHKNFMKVIKIVLLKFVNFVERNLKEKERKMDIYQEQIFVVKNA